MTLPLAVGQYELVRLVAQGGMADIYLAKQRGLDRHVAVKVLSAARSTDPDARTLFRDEARVLAMLSHANLAGVLEVAAEGAVQYMAMEYVHGVDLRNLMQTVKSIDCETACAIAKAAAAGLDHAHRRCGPDGKPLHVVHRDVSLSNIMVTHDGGVKVVDFGIARTAMSTHTTNPGVVRGKASYMSPEQALGDPVDLRTDIFALGIVLYEMTTGRRCFAGTSDFERMLAIVRGEWVTPTAVVSGYPPALAKIIATCLQTEPSQRYASAAALIDALDQLARTEGWIAGAGSIAALMRDVYGDVPEPQLHTSEITARSIVDEADLPVVAQPQPTKPITRDGRRRLAHGTCSEGLDDDQPTRGRRSVPKIFSAQFAA
jgi:eukaryotic-like serine/threonine-protein kinase